MKTHDIERDDLDPKALILVGLDSCVIGVDQNMWLVYDYYKMVLFFMERDGMTREDSVSWISYNILCICPARFVINFSGTFGESE